jgi:hypothetical protein
MPTNPVDIVTPSIFSGRIVKVVHHQSFGIRNRRRNCCVGSRQQEISIKLMASLTKHCNCDLIGLTVLKRIGRSIDAIDESRIFRIVRLFLSHVQSAIGQTSNCRHIVHHSLRVFVFDCLFALPRMFTNRILCKRPNRTD